MIRGFARLVKNFIVDARLPIVGGESPTPDPVENPEIGRLTISPTTKVSAEGSHSSASATAHGSATTTALLTPSSQHHGTSRSASPPLRPWPAEFR